MSLSEDLHGIAAHLGRRRDLGYGSTIRPPELQLPIRLAIELVPLLVDRAVVSATQQREIRERGGPAVRPVTDVMALAEPHAAAREAAAAIAMVQRPP